jgi:hypothetical protein
MALSNKTGPTLTLNHHKNLITGQSTICNNKEQKFAVAIKCAMKWFL